MSKVFLFKYAVLLWLAVGSGAMLYAQDLPPCERQASDVDGDGYGYEFGSSCIVTIESMGPADITSRSNGNPVKLWRAYWTVEQLANQEVLCNLYQWVPWQNAYVQYDWTISVIHRLSSASNPTPWFGFVESLEYNSQGVRPSSYDQDLWLLNDGVYSGPYIFQLSAYVEIVDTGTERYFRDWESSDRYSQCKSVNPTISVVPAIFEPTQNIADLIQVTCVDSDPVGDGWGWDGYASCRFDEGGNNSRLVPSSYPDADDEVDPNCDYSDAHIYGGWGWNPVTSTSCAPVDSNTNNNCDYSDAHIYNGWGWDPIAQVSCAP